MGVISVMRWMYRATMVQGGIYVHDDNGPKRTVYMEWCGVRGMDTVYAKHGVGAYRCHASVVGLTTAGSGRGFIRSRFTRSFRGIRWTNIERWVASQEGP